MLMLTKRECTNCFVIYDTPSPFKSLFKYLLKSNVHSAIKQAYFRFNIQMLSVDQAFYVSLRTDI